MRYFAVTCHRGHCGIGRSNDITFAIKAYNLLDACAQARKMPGVKHTRSVINGREITQEEYIAYRAKSAYCR